MEKPLILVTNDDGITAAGIQNLIAVAKELGDVVVVAPDSPQSGQGHAITLRDPLRLKPVTIYPGVEAYECSGTPVDCVKLATNIVLKGRKADLCVSGINHGSNASLNILYSGTMAAAMEASMEGINSVGFSLLDFSSTADFGPSLPYIRKIMEYILAHGMKETKLLNVNIPKLGEGEIKGIRVCRQAEARWNEEYVAGKDPMGRPYYWLTGKFENLDHGKDTDIWALENGYISVVPSMHDLTSYAGIREFEGMAG